MRLINNGAQGRAKCSVLEMRLEAKNQSNHKSMLDYL